MLAPGTFDAILISNTYHEFTQSSTMVKHTAKRSNLAAGWLRLNHIRPRIKTKLASKKASAAISRQIFWNGNCRPPGSSSKNAALQHGKNKVTYELVPLRINGEIVPDALVRSEAQLLRPRYAEMLAECDPITGEMQLRAIARRQAIERVLLRQEADQDPQPIAAEELDRAMGQMRAASASGSTCITPMNESTWREDAKIQIRLDRLLGKIFGHVSKPKQKELLDYYRKHPEEFEAPELVRAAHVVKNVDETHPQPEALAAIQRVREQLDQGAEFAELADAHSDCPGAGGDLGYFPRGHMVEEFDAVVFDLAVGEVSPIFRTPFGFHIAKLLDRKPAGLQPFNQVRAGLEEGMHRVRQQGALEDYLDTLIARAEIRDVKTPAPASTSP